MKIEELDNALAHHTISVTRFAAGNETFERIREVRVGDRAVMIEWWPNVCYLHTPDNLTVIFNSLKQSNTWPNESKMNLQFYDKRGICAILKLE